MTPAELQSYLDLTAAIEQHKQALDTAVKAKQQLARTLYDRYGCHAVYRIGEGDDALDLMIGRTKGGTHYFAPRVRYPKESRLAKAEKKRIDRAARMQAFPTQASVIRPAPDSDVPTEAEIEQARAQGRYDQARSTAKRAAQLAPRDRATAKRAAHPDDEKLRLPIVGDVEHPPAPIEPRLLAIQEPSGILLGDSEASPKIDHGSSS